MAKVMPLPGSTDDMDPFSNQPPLFESEEERERRVAVEEAAKAISDRIDEELERARVAERRGPKPIKILLLDFQLMYDPKAFRAERASWRAVIQLNIVRSIHNILDTISRAQKLQSSSSTSTHYLHTSASAHSLNRSIHSSKSPTTISSTSPTSPSPSSSSAPSPSASAPSAPSPSSSTPSPSSSTSPTTTLPSITPEVLELKARLEPLLHVEAALIRRLTYAGSGEVEATRRVVMEGGVDVGVGGKVGNVNGHGNGINTGNGWGMGLGGREVAINSATPWKNAFSRIVRGGGERDSVDSANGGEGEGDTWDESDPDDPGVVLNRLSGDMIRLWRNGVVSRLLDIQGLRMEELSGFFLDSLERVTAPRYVPTDDDILRARLKTLGVSEHRFKITTAAWAPYFDDMDAIIFLAPISCFDQVLEEDHKVNRLVRFLFLWGMIVY
ncbi:hypothetical protein CVT24_006934 [Panaeolus cyanescens]|uniref:Uncharacterized protein n=1 Tax=Panaeolus cyanescens TaxID=181874 RepID=A0A409VK45_9AGAR|nr:hypothetical protein CVT24_006934 [Panaeolus cyanescens]